MTTTPPNGDGDWWGISPQSPDRRQVTIWLDPTTNGTSILVTTRDRHGHQETGAFWQSDQPTNNDDGGDR